MECIEQPLDSARTNGRQTVQVLRNGDLATKMYLRVELPAVLTSDVGNYNADVVRNCRVAYVRRLGHALIKSLEVTVGGSSIDKQYGTWLDLWYELSHTYEQERGYGKMIGDVPELTELQPVTATSTSVVLPDYTLYIPLQFWFNRNTGLALPLIALQYHEVRINVEFNPASTLFVSSGATTYTRTSEITFTSAGLMVDYVYLDSEERRRFAQVGHEYLIEQVQFGGEESKATGNSQKFKLDFNHPCKEIVWASKVGCFAAQNTSRNTFLTYVDGSDNSSSSSALNWAARNLAHSMCYLTRNSSPPTGWTAENLTVESNLKTTIHTFTMTDGPVVDVVLDNDSATDGSGLYLVYRVDVLTKNSVSLAASLQNITLAATLTVTAGVVTAIDGVTTSATTTHQVLPANVTVNAHDLNLADLSVPVGDMVNNRATASSFANSGSYPFDVKVVQFSNYGLDLGGNGNMVSTAKLQLNGHDRFDEQAGNYFNYVQPAQHHTRTPADGVNVYSFGLHPEQHQPSGSANLSRIDTTNLIVTFGDNLRSNRTVQLDYSTDTLVYIMAVNYNVFRIMSGMGGLAYAN
jgi:hypothetical protein